MEIQGPLAGEGLQGRMGQLGLLVNQVVMESLEFLDRQGELDAQGLGVSANHTHIHRLLIWNIRYLW